MVKTVQQNIEIVQGNLDKLETSLTIADENGLFKEHTNSITFLDILSYMDAANNELVKNKDNPDKAYAESWLRFMKANNQFNVALNSASRAWRIKYLFGVPFAIYYIGLLIVLIFAWTFFNPDITTTKIFWVPAYAFLWGLAGSILQGLWWLWQHVSGRKLRKAWTPWYLCLPVIGMLLGALMYLVITAGLITTTGNATVTSENFIMLLCGLAGFASKWAVGLLDSIQILIKAGG